MQGNKWINILILTVLALIWGSSFILMKRGLVVYSAPQVACLRLLLSGLVLCPYVILNLRKVTFSQLKYILLFGLLNAGIPPFFFAQAQTGLPSSTAGVLNALTPLFTLITGALFFNVGFNINKLAGVLLGLAGCFIIIFVKAGNNLFAFHDSHLLFLGFLVVLATLLYGLSNNISKTFLQQIPAITIAAFAYTCMAIPAGIYLFTGTDFTDKMQRGTPAFEALGYIFILAAMGSALAMFLFNKLIQRSNALFASFITYFIPFVAISWGVFDKETIGLVQFLGLGIILLGVYIVSVRK